MHKKMVKHNNDFCILVPVFYDHEEKPSWRKYFVGTLEKCNELFPSAPDFLNATYEENRENREWKRKEYTFLLSIGKVQKAEKIRAQYCF